MCGDRGSQQRNWDFWIREKQKLGRILPYYCIHAVEPFCKKTKWFGSWEQSLSGTSCSACLAQIPAYMSFLQHYRIQTDIGISKRYLGITIMINNKHNCFPGWLLTNVSTRSEWLVCCATASALADSVRCGHIFILQVIHTSIFLSTLLV